MADKSRKIALFSSFMKFATIFCLIGLLLAYLCPFVHPSTFWPLPFFGLAYPVIMIFTIVFLVFWAFKKSRWFFVVLIVLFIGGKLHFRMISLPFGKEELPENTETLKLLSYNVRLFDLYNYEENKYANRNAIFKYLQETEADVVCFQEFYHQDKPTVFPTRDTLTGLLKTPYFHERYSHKLSGRQNFGIAMFSKYPMIARGDVIFDDPENKDNNYCIFADIVKGADTFRIYNVHLQSIKFQKDDYALFGDGKEQAGEMKSTARLMIDKLRIAFPKRADQAKRVVEHMEQSPYEVIICGDFNDTPLSYCYNTFYSKYIDAFRNSASGIGVTYAGKVPAGRIDYIFHSKKIHSANFKVQKDVFSDHRSVYCEIWKDPKIETTTN
jgi:endonuclease/exonuclease/phosphatase family metal-dependent hydrolase